MFHFGKLQRSEPPDIPDHELLRGIGRGGYGEVWLARSVTGTYRGVKVLYRSTFEEERPYEREFIGIKKFEPISRTHPGLVAILHVGRNERAGYFYYVMEVADDIATGPAIHPETYKPKTLHGMLALGDRLPPGDCVRIGLALTAALGYLHKQGLVHRDIKPANIIFVNGVPKFADVGLVADIGGATSFVGTEGYLPPEGPGAPAADIFGLGKVLYQLVTRKGLENFPQLPTNLDERDDIPQLMRLNQIILKACDPDAIKRFRSAEEMHAALTEVAQASPLSQQDVAAVEPAAAVTRVIAPPLPAKAQPRVVTKPLRIAILYKANIQPDGHLLELLHDKLIQSGSQVFIDKHLAVGVEWAREIEQKIRDSDAAVVLLSATSVQSEMIAYELEIAYQAAQQQHGKPRILPVRIQYTRPLPSALATILDPLQYFLWEGPQHDDRLVTELLRSLETSVKSIVPDLRAKLESIGGAVPLESQFYIVRPTDQEFQTAMGRHDSIVLVKGARQMGKTSLLARGLQHARQSGARVVLTDFQKLNATHLVSVESFFLTLGDFLASQLDLDVLPEDVWDKRRSPNTNFERYLRREVLGKLTTHLVWGLDEVDRLFTCEFGSEVFGLFRSWHNERALDPGGPWSRLTLAIAYATEAHLFITDVNQSPFNVGTRLTLDDFTLEQVADLNQRHGSPLQGAQEIKGFFELFGGQPYLVRRGLHELASGNLGFAGLAAQADRDEGMFGDHLRRILVLLAKDAQLCEVVRGILRGDSNPDPASFYRLRSAGVMAGDSPQEVRPRCRIYATYLKRHLL